MGLADVPVLACRPVASRWRSRRYPGGALVLDHARAAGDPYSPLAPERRWLPSVADQLEAVEDQLEPEHELPLVIVGHAVERGSEPRVCA